MPTQSTAPRWVKGALVAIDVINPGAAPTTIPFQYNPTELSRTLTPKRAGGAGRPAASLGFAGAPDESFSLDVQISALHQADAAAGMASQTLGIHPLLSALEMLLYPHSDQVGKNDKLLDQGQIEIGGGVYDAPLTLLVWGPNRVLPVQLSSVSIVEEYFDTNLNPIHAKLTLKLETLSYSDLDHSHKGYGLFLTYQKNKEQMGKQGILHNTAQFIGAEAAGKLG